MKNLIFSLTLGFLVFGSLLSQAQEIDQNYSQRTQEFLKTFEAQFEVLYPTELSRLGVQSIESRVQFTKPSADFLIAVKSQVARLEELYQKVIIEGQRDKALSAEMNTLESNLVFVTEVGLRNLLHILVDFEKEGKVTKKIRTRLKHLGTLANELRSGKEINSKSKENLMSLLDIRQTIPGQMLQLGCSYLANVCIKRKPISDWLKIVGDQGYSQRQGPGFSTVGFEAAQSLPSNSVVIVVSNHQDGALDVAIPAALSEKLGLDGGLKLLAHSSNYPFVQHMNQGENLVFTDRGDWQKEATDSIDSNQNKSRKVGLLVYSEGLVSGPLSQFPLISKVGALSAARKWAHRYSRERPVYLIVLTTNAHDFSTSHQFKLLEVRLESLEQVPNEKVVFPDDWITAKRFEIENLFNRPRTNQVNLESRLKTPGMHGLFETQSNLEIQGAAAKCIDAVRNK